MGSDGQVLSMQERIDYIASIASFVLQEGEESDEDNEETENN